MTARQRRRVDGVLFLDKPKGISSQGAVARVKRLFNAEKVGHTGTLDPAATGLLPLCFGEATKFSQFLLDADKRYRATLRLGLTTTTADLEGDVTSQSPVTCSAAEIVAAVCRFQGDMEQVPPMYSALKHQGKPLYRYARAGEEIPREPRRVTIHRIAVVESHANDIVIDVACSKGTYVRVLAEDIGRMLGCGACLADLVRTGVGSFGLDEAIGLESIERLSPDDQSAWLRPTDTLIRALPRFDLDTEQAAAMGKGQAVSLPLQGVEGLVRLYGPAGGFLGVARAHSPGRLEPQRLVARAGQSLNA